MPTEIRLETVQQLIDYAHELDATCPACHSHGNVDLNRLVRKGLGDKLICELSIGCRKCRTKVGFTVVPKRNRTMAPDYFGG